LSSCRSDAEILPTILEALERIDELRAASHDALGLVECDRVFLKHRDGFISLLN
jgi:hypothetical protein